MAGFGHNTSANDTYVYMCNIMLVVLTFLVDYICDQFLLILCVPMVWTIAGQHSGIPFPPLFSDFPLSIIIQAIQYYFNYMTTASIKVMPPHSYDTFKQCRKNWSPHCI